MIHCNKFDTLAESKIGPGGLTNLKFYQRQWIKHIKWDIPCHNNYLHMTRKWWKQTMEFKKLHSKHTKWWIIPQFPKWRFILQSILSYYGIHSFLSITKMAVGAYSSLMAYCGMGRWWWKTEVKIFRIIQVVRLYCNFMSACKVSFCFKLT